MPVTSPSENSLPFSTPHPDDPAFSPDPRKNPDYITRRQLSPPPAGHPTLTTRLSTGKLPPDGNIVAESPFQPPPPPNSPVTPAASPQPPFTPFPVSLAAIAENSSPSCESLPDDLVFESVPLIMPQQLEPTPLPAKKGLGLLSRFRSVRGSDDKPSARAARTLSVIHESRPGAGPRHGSAPQAAQLGSRPPNMVRAATLGGNTAPKSASRPQKHGKLIRGQDVDRVDEMDATNPWGISLHHDGPYEAAVQAMKAKRQISSDLGAIPYSTHPLQANNAPYVPPQVPIGVSINLSPGQILPRDYLIHQASGSPFPRWDEGAPPKPPIQRNSMLIPNRASRLYQPPPVDPSPPRSMENLPRVTDPVLAAPPPPPPAPPVLPPVIVEEPEEVVTQPSGPSIDIGLAMLEFGDEPVTPNPRNPEPRATGPVQPVQDDGDFNPYDPSHIEDHGGSTSALPLSASNSGESTSRQRTPPQDLFAPPLKTVQFSDSVEVLEDPPEYTQVDTSAPTSRSVSPLPPVNRSPGGDRPPLPPSHLGHLSPPNHNDAFSSSSNVAEVVRTPNAGPVTPATSSMTSSPWVEPNPHITQLPGAWNSDQLTGQMDARGAPPQIRVDRDREPSPRVPGQDRFHPPPVGQYPQQQQHRPQSTFGGGTPPQRPSPPRSMMTGDSRSTHHSISTYSSSQYSGKPPSRRPVPKHLVMPAPLNPAAAANRLQHRTSQLPPPSQSGYLPGPSSQHQPMMPQSNAAQAPNPPFSTSAANAAYHAQRRVSQAAPVTPQAHAFSGPAHNNLPRAQDIPIAASNKLKKRASVMGPPVAQQPVQTGPHPVGPQHHNMHHPPPSSNYPPPPIPHYQHQQYHPHPHPHQLPPNGVPIVAGGPQKATITTVSFKPTVIDQAPLPLEKMLGRAKTERVPKRVLSKRKTAF